MIGAIKRNVGSAVFRALRVFYQPGEQADLSELAAERILTVQGLRIGDTIATLPAIRSLCARWPDAEIVALASPACTEILELSKLVDRMVPWPADGGRLASGKQAVADLAPVDVAVVFDCTLTSMLVADSVRARASIGYDSYNRGFGLTHPVSAPSYWNRPVSRYRESVPVRTQSGNWCRLLRQVGIEAESSPPVLWPGEEAMTWAGTFLGDAGASAVVALHPGAEPAYQWLPERFAEVGDRLADELAAAIVITGGPADVPLAESIAAQMSHDPLVAAGKTSLAQMAALLKQVALLVSVDTSAGHVAAAVGTPTVALFGPGDQWIWAPQGERVKVLVADNCTCLGCKASKCDRNDHPCMAGISVDLVISASGQMLARHDGSAATTTDECPGPGVPS